MATTKFKGQPVKIIGEVHCPQLEQRLLILKV